MSREEHGRRIGAQNRAKVLDWFQAHPGGTNVECGRALGLSGPAVGRHAKAIRCDWPIVQPPVVEGHLSTRRHWIIIHEPGRIPEKKGAFRNDQVIPFLRELDACRPDGTLFTVCSLTWDYDLWVDSGRDRLVEAEVMDSPTDEDWAEFLATGGA